MLQLASEELPATEFAARLRLTGGAHAPGRDATTTAAAGGGGGCRPKTVRLDLQWLRGDDEEDQQEDPGNQTSVTVNVTFGIPVELLVLPVDEASPGGDESGATTTSLHGHLTFGFSQPRLLSLSVEEARRLRRADGPEEQLATLARCLTFVLRVGFWLAVDTQGKHNHRHSQPFRESLRLLSYCVNWVVREMARKYADCLDDAFEGRNSEERFLECLRLLRDRLLAQSAELPVISESARIATLALLGADGPQPPLLPEATLRLVEFFELVSESAETAGQSEAATGLLDRLLGYYRMRAEGRNQSKALAGEILADLGNFLNR